MVTSTQARNKYGEPAADNPCMTLWDVPTEIEIGVIPKKIYCNKDLKGPLEIAFRNLIATGCVDELKTWDGCFNIRKSRGMNSISLHSWGLAVDVNAFENGLYKTPKLSPEFVLCFVNAGFDWGGNFSRKDGMHFQLKSI